MRGSVLLEGWVDSAIEIKKENTNDGTLRIKLKHTLLRHSELPPEPIVAELQDNFEFEVVSALAPTTKDKVVEYLIKNKVKEFSFETLIKDGVAGRKAIYSARQFLLAEGLVKQLSKGEYLWHGGLT